jgi:hypothetical protein
MVIAKVEVVAVVVVLVVDKAEVGRGRGAVMELYRQANKKYEVPRLRRYLTWSGSGRGL